MIMSESDNTTTQESTNDSLLGHQVSSVSVKIDYEIIQHFSSYLYSSPYKAIEELVANGFDAEASQVRVYIPGRFTSGHVVVWDNGGSMDVEGLQQLWWIARSPKVGTSRIIRRSGRRDRKVIGKFGIGKLASYALGQTVTHLCKKDDRFLLVGLDYGTIPKDTSSGSPHQIPIYELSDVQARQWLESRLDGSAEAFDSLWEGDAWTVAVVAKLNEGIVLKGGRLRWLMGFGMPLRPDFQVIIDDSLVESRRVREAVRKFTFTDNDVMEMVERTWKQARDLGDVDGQIERISVTDGVALRLPLLGTVTAEGYVFDKTLLEEGKEDEEDSVDGAGRTYGFFIMVRDRLINPDDAKFLLHEPSYGTFNRSQIVIHADELDDQLLADRENIRQDNPKSNELKVLQRALYRFARQALEQREAKDESVDGLGNLLPVEVRDLFRDPLSSLIVREGHTERNFEKAYRGELDRLDLGTEHPMSELSDDGRFLINTTHPFYRQFVTPSGTKAEIQNRFRRQMEAFAVGERLTEGRLLDLGVADEIVKAVMDWRDAFFKQIANRLTYNNVDQLVDDVIRTSYTGGRAFEEALAKFFRMMGFVADREGASGREDVMVVAPVGSEHRTFTLEAKGSKDAIGTDAADVGAAADHRDSVHAEFALIVAREFSARTAGTNGGVFKQCQATGRVSMIEVDTLITLYRAVQAYTYSLGAITDVLSLLMPPLDKQEQVQALTEPITGFDYRRVLDRMWTLQQGASARDVVPMRQVWQELRTDQPDLWPDNRSFSRQLEALSILTSMVVFDPTEQSGRLLQHPDLVVRSIELALAGRSPTTEGDVPSL